MNKSSLQARIIAITAITVGLLAIPFLAMQVSDEVQWSREDFVLMGILIGSTGFAVDLIYRHSRTRKRALFAISFICVLFLYVWAELAVGVFTNLGD